MSIAASTSDRNDFLDDLRPRARINPMTGMPYGWDEGDEDALIDALPTAGVRAGVRP